VQSVLNSIAVARV